MYFMAAVSGPTVAAALSLLRHSVPLRNNVPGPPIGPSNVFYLSLRRLTLQLSRSSAAEKACDYIRPSMWNGSLLLVAPRVDVRRANDATRIKLSRYGSAAAKAARPYVNKENSRYKRYITQNCYRPGLER